MDIQLEKKKGIQKKHLPYIGGGVVILLLLGWIIFGNHASTLKVDGKSLNIADVTYGKFNDYIRVNGQVQPISVVQSRRGRYRAGKGGGRRSSREERRRDSPSQQLQPGFADSECGV